MSTALVPTFGSRPPFVALRETYPAAWWCGDRVITGTHGPVTVVLAVHDAWHLRTVRAWKRRIAAANGADQREAIVGYRHWQAREQAWYAALKEAPPLWRPMRRLKPRRVRCARGHDLSPGSVNVTLGSDGMRRCQRCMDVTRTRARQIAAKETR